MARILPDVSAATGPLTPTRQRFFNKVESDEDKALKIMQAISGGVRTASDLYGLGSDIYQRYIKETPEEALRRRQEEIGDAATRQRIARNVAGPGGMKGDEYDPMLGSRVDLSGFEGAQKDFAQDFAATDQETFIPGRTKPAPFTETPEGALDYLGAPAEAAAPAPATTSLDESEAIGDLGKLGRLLPQYAAQRGMNAAEAQKMVATGDWQGLGPGSTETFGQYLDRMQQSGRFGGAPAAVDPAVSRFEEMAGRVLERTGDSELVNTLAKKSSEEALRRGRPDLVPQLKTVADKYREKLSPRAQATFDYIQSPQQQQFLQQPRTASEFAMGREEGRDFSVRELNMAYNSLWRQGRQQEAEELVRLAGAAKDVGEFVKSGTDSPVLVRARAEEAVAKMAKGGDRLSAPQAVSLAKMKDKRRGRNDGGGGGTNVSRPKGSPKDPTPDERQSKEFLIVAAERGIQAARDLYYDRKTKRATRQTTKDILAEARRILRDVPQEKFRTAPAYELVRSQYGQNFYETAATEGALSDVKSEAQEKLSLLIDIPVQDFGDLSVVSERIKEMKRERDALPKKITRPKLSDYTGVGAGVTSVDDFRLSSPDAYKEQTKSIKKAQEEGVRRRKKLTTKITAAENAFNKLRD
jgi:hypothetical protein